MRPRERLQCPTEWRYGVSPRSAPVSRSSVTARSCASPPCTADRPSQSGRRSSSLPSKPMAVSVGRSWRRPISKSTGSWPGVILSAPVPKSGFTSRSAMIGTRRPTSGTIAVLPIRWRQRSSSGCTATAVSARMVIGRTVATRISPPSSTGYATSYRTSSTS